MIVSFLTFKYAYKKGDPVALRRKDNEDKIEQNEDHPGQTELSRQMSRTAKV